MDFKTDFKIVAIFYQQIESQCKEGGKNTSHHFQRRRVHLGALGSSQSVGQGGRRGGRQASGAEKPAWVGVASGHIELTTPELLRGELCGRGSESPQQCEPWHMHE